MPKDNIPEIRVAGFDGEWSKTNLGKVASILGGNAWKSSDYSDDGEYLVVTISNVSGDFFIDDSTGNHISCDDPSPYMLVKDDILISLTGNVGRVSKMTGAKGVLNQRVGKIVLHDEKVSKDYLFHVLRNPNFENAMIDAGRGAAQKNISNSDVLGYNLSVPSDKEEQRQIGSVFEKLDNLISQHQHKYDALVAVKKAMLEKMFPKEGETVPEVRFAGFTDPWEQRKLGDCFTERVESMPDGELISVTINDGIKKFSELGRHDNSNDDKSKYKKVCVGDIAYNSMRMWQGASGYSPYEGIVSPAYTVLSPNSGINSKCLAYQFKLPEMIHTFQVNSQGITSDNWNLKYPALSQIEIFVSKDEQEQAQIAEYFENLDHLITLHQRKYEVLKNLKSALLNKMFVNTTK